MVQRHKTGSGAGRLGAMSQGVQASTGGRWVPGVLLAAAAVLTAVALVQLPLAWASLPMPKLERLDANRVVEAFRAARGTWTGGALNGALLTIMSSHVATAMRQPDRLPDLFEDARGGYARVAGTSLSRLQLAALAMLQLERDNVPLANWWAALEPYFAGAEAASLGHFLPEALQANAAVYMELGLPGGSARRSAQNTVGYPHGVFLQHFSEQMERVARAQEDAGDPASAATCRRVVRRLLRQWAVDPGPAAVRLLAAELLIAQLEPRGMTTAPAAAAEVVRGLRQWRAAYREQASQRPTPLPLISNSYAALPDQAAHDRLRDAVAMLAWTAPALIVAAVGTGLLAVPWLRRAKGGLRGPLVGGLLHGVVLIAAGLVYVLAGPGMQEDLRRLGAPELGWPRYPWVSAGIALVGLGLVLAWPCRAGQRFSRAAGWATATCTVLAIALLANCWLTRAATVRYETRTAELLDAGEFAAVAGASAERHLQPLRAWQP